MTRILVVDGTPEFGNALAGKLPDDIQQFVLVTNDAARAPEAIVTRQPEVVVMGPSLAPDAALAVSQRVLSAGASPAFVMVVFQPTTALMRAALKAGVSDVVSAEEGADEAASAVLSAAGRQGVRHTATRKRRGRVVTMLSPKGGVGKSVLAANVAVALAEKTKKRVILVDLDLQFGDIGVILQVAPERTLYDVAQCFDRLDLEMLRGFLTQHESSGVMTLLAPVSPEQADSLSAPQIARILEMLSELADYVVIDTPAALNDTLLAALDRSDLVYAIATMDVASVKDTKIAVQKLAQLGYNHGSVRVVLNRSDSKVLMQSADVLKTLERPVAACVPSDRIVPRSINKGLPVVSDAPRSGVARGIFEIAQNITSWTGGEEHVAH